MKPSELESAKKENEKAPEKSRYKAGEMARDTMQDEATANRAKQALDNSQKEKKSYMDEIEKDLRERGF